MDPKALQWVELDLVIAIAATSRTSKHSEMLLESSCGHECSWAFDVVTIGVLSRVVVGCDRRCGRICGWGVGGGVVVCCCRSLSLRFGPLHVPPDIYAVVVVEVPWVVVVGCLPVVVVVGVVVGVVAALVVDASRLRVAVAEHKGHVVVIFAPCHVKPQPSHA